MALGAGVVKHIKAKSELRNDSSTYYIFVLKTFSTSTTTSKLACNLYVAEYIKISLKKAKTANVMLQSDDKEQHVCAWVWAKCLLLGNSHGLHSNRIRSDACIITFRRFAANAHELLIDCDVLRRAFVNFLLCRLWKRGVSFLFCCYRVSLARDYYRSEKPICLK